jgi:hypothetical protein
MTAAHYHFRSAAALALGVLVCAATWLLTEPRWGTTGVINIFYAIGILGAAVPAFVSIACIVWLRRERSRGESAARVRWLWPLLSVNLLFLAWMVTGWG